MVNFLEQSGDPAKALTYANRLDELEPGNPQVLQMLKELHEHLQDSKSKSSIKLLTVMSQFIPNVQLIEIWVHLRLLGIHMADVPVDRARRSPVELWVGGTAVVVLGILCLLVLRAIYIRGAMGGDSLLHDLAALPEARRSCSADDGRCRR